MLGLNIRFHVVTVLLINYAPMNCICEYYLDLLFTLNSYFNSIVMVAGFVSPVHPFNGLQT